MTTATVIIPTLCRPDQLSNALSSLISMQCVEKIQRVIVVDNDPQASALETVERLSRASPFDMKWVHEPRPGIAYARNTGLDHAQDAELIAFLDDDEITSSNWLKHLIAVQQQTQADVVFGPIAGKAPSAPTELRAFIEDFFGRTGPQESGLIDHYYGCGNSLLNRATALPTPDPFDIRSNETGGEDDILFSRLQSQGKRFAWASEAWVDEVAPANRANMGYVLKRAFAYGQGPSQNAVETKAWGKLIGWMCVGTAQLMAFGTAAVFARFLGHKRYPMLARRAIEGSGKLFWFRGLEPKLYGQSEIERFRSH